MTTGLMEILDRDAAIMRAKMAEVMPAADGEARQARELMILLHTVTFVIQMDETSTAEELREFAGQVLDKPGLLNSRCRNIPVSPPEI